MAVVASCTALPHEGPDAAQIDSTYKSANTSGFVLIDIDREVADYLRTRPQPSLSDRFGRGNPMRAETIGIGDVLTVMIWEADQGGIFSSNGMVNRGEIPAVTVDTSGYIQIPYAGTIKAVGRTPRQVANAITAQLRQKTVEPQVHVAKAHNVASTVTVTGGVKTPGIVPLSLRGDDLMDVLAMSGGSQFPSYETLITLTRNGKTASAYLAHVIEHPNDNVYLRGGDQISVEQAPLTYSAFGAVSKKGLVPFGSLKLSLMEAVGKVSGLNDDRADPKGVYLMRFEPASTAYQLAGLSNSPGGDRKIPVIYRFNLQDPNQYFFAQAIGMKDKDVIYVANAPSVEVDKFLGILGKALAPSLNTARAVNQF